MVARTKEIHFGISGTVNLGNFESIRVEYSETMELERGEDVATVRKNLRSRVKRVVEDEVVEAKRDAERAQKKART